jgi:hypothetical protein
MTKETLPRTVEEEVESGAKRGMPCLYAHRRDAPHSERVLREH